MPIMPKVTFDRSENVVYIALPKIESGGVDKTVPVSDPPARSTVISMSRGP
jgi:hypothetical protein